MRSAGFQPAFSLEKVAASSRIITRQRKRLPHWETKHGIYFVTFRLHDSLPKAVLDRIAFQRNDIVQTARQMGRALSSSEKERLRKLSTRRVESYLDRGAGECLLSRPPVADVVATALRHFDGTRYKLYAWCVMPNHVHAVLAPLGKHLLAEILHSWKSFSALRANRLLGRKGEFWQREYYDHLIRDQADFVRAIQYVAQNPARVGLKNWPWVWTKAED